MLNDFADKKYLVGAASNDATAADPAGLKARFAAARQQLGNRWCCAVPVKRIAPAKPKRGAYYPAEFGSRVLTEAAHKRIRRASKPTKRAA